MKRYCEEMRLIQSALIHRDEYKALFDSMDEYKKAHNYNGCAVNKILCYFENIILGHAVHILNKNNLHILIMLNQNNLKNSRAERLESIILRQLVLLHSPL